MDTGLASWVDMIAWEKDVVEGVVGSRKIYFSKATRTYCPWKQWISLLSFDKLDDKAFIVEPTCVLSSG